MPGRGERVAHGAKRIKEGIMGLDFTGLGSVFDFAKGVMDKIWPPQADPNEKMKAQMALQELLEKRENQVIDAQKSIIVAEMQQGDNYTKRARPTIVYIGLAFIGLVNVLLPMIAWITLSVTGKPLTGMPDIQLPGEFWAAWGGVCSIWVIGRSAEKRGAANKVINMITGT